MTGTPSTGLADTCTTPGHPWQGAEGPARTLAGQAVGPIDVKACRIRRHGRTVAWHRKKLCRRSALPPGFRGQMIRLHPDATTGTPTATLQLVRSFDIP